MTDVLACLGALGVITSVTLRCEPAFRLCAVEAPQPVDGCSSIRASSRAVEGQHADRASIPRRRRALLSPAYERESCSVAVHAYRGMTWQPYFRAVEKLMWELGGRPHWGKLHSLTSETLGERYPAWGRFQAVRARFDPDGRFRNAYTDRVLGLPCR